jgi:hypothetical protein
MCHAIFGVTNELIFKLLRAGHEKFETRSFSRKNREKAIRTGTEFALLDI